MDHPVLLILVKVTIFGMMLDIGVNLSFQQLISLWRRPSLLIRSLLAVIVLVPVLVILLLKLFDLPRAVATGLVLLAVAPGAPLTTRRSQMAKGDIPYSASLQLTLALLAVFTAPVTLGIFNALFEIGTTAHPLLGIAGNVAMVQLLPVSVGLLIRKFGQEFSAMIGKPLIVIANVLFLLLIVLAIVPGFRDIDNIGVLPLTVIGIMAAASLAIGHLLGGPAPGEHSTLAIASIARNIGLALFIAALNDIEKNVVPTILCYMILGAIVAIPYSVWTKRRAAHAK